MPEEDYDPLADDVCDKCMRSGVQISHTDENGNTVCYECSEGESEDANGQE